MHSGTRGNVGPSHPGKHCTGTQGQAGKIRYPDRAVRLMATASTALWRWYQYDHMIAQRMHP